MQNSKVSTSKRTYQKIAVISLVTVLIIIFLFGIIINVNMNKKLLAMAKGFDSDSLNGIISKEVEGYMNTKYIASDIDGGDETGTLTNGANALTESEIEQIVNRVVAVVETELDDNVYEGTATLVAERISEQVKELVKEEISNQGLDTETISETVTTIVLKDISTTLKEYQKEIKTNTDSISEVEKTITQFTTRLEKIEKSNESLKLSYDNQIKELKDKDAELAKKIDSISAATVSKSSLEEVAKLYSVQITNLNNSSTEEFSILLDTSQNSLLIAADIITGLKSAETNENMINNTDIENITTLSNKVKTDITNVKNASFAYKNSENVNQQTALSTALTNATNTLRTDTNLLLTALENAKGSVVDNLQGQISNNREALGMITNNASKTSSALNNTVKSLKDTNKTIEEKTTSIDNTITTLETNLVNADGEMAEQISDQIEALRQAKEDILSNQDNVEDIADQLESAKGDIDNKYLNIYSGLPSYKYGEEDGVPCLTISIPENVKKE